MRDVSGIWTPRNERPSADIVDCSINTVLPVSFRWHIKIPTCVNTSRPATRAECSRYTYTSIQMHAWYINILNTRTNIKTISHTNTHTHTHKYVHACINIKWESAKKRKYRYLTNCSQAYAILCYYICFMCTPLYFFMVYTILWNVSCLCCTPLYEMFYHLVTVCSVFGWNLVWTYPFVYCVSLRQDHTFEPVNTKQLKRNI